MHALLDPLHVSRPVRASSFGQKIASLQNAWPVHSLHTLKLACILGSRKIMHVLSFKIVQALVYRFVWHAHVHMRVLPACLAQLDGEKLC